MHHGRINNVVGHLSSNPTNGVVIISYSRTPIGSFGGALSATDSATLASFAIKHCFERENVHARVYPGDVDEVFLGHVLSAGCGQAPVRQAALKAGIPVDVPCTSVNKVCASGMKALTIASSLIRAGNNELCIVGGMESMSRVPFLLPSHRKGKRLGNDSIVDGLIFDGLWDVYNNKHMGNCAEKTARDLGITRKMQDDYSEVSANRAIHCNKNGIFSKEIVGVAVDKKTTVTSDEQLSRLQPSRLSGLVPAFDPKGSVTAGNASAISDGAAAMLICSAGFAKLRNVNPIAHVVAWADGETDPIDFGIAPNIAIKKALTLAGLGVKDVDLWEINEAFAAVVLANAKLLDIPLSKINVLGGAISLGHPLGCSGARIVCTLLTAMAERSAKIGCAAICNGGGGATAVILRMC